MGWFFSILHGFIGSLIATAIAAFLAYITRRWWFDRFQTELAHTYHGQEKLIEALKEDAMNAESVRILSMRGETVGEALDELLEKGAAKATIIISSLTNNDAIEKRRKALGEDDHVYRTKLVQTSGLYYALGLTDNGSEVEGKIRLKFHEQDLSSRLIFIDDFVYVSTYPKAGKLNDVKHFKYRKNKSGGSAYTAYEHYFNSILNNSKSYPEEESA